MNDKIKKYYGVFPAFYACYDDSGAVSPGRVRALTRHLIDRGVSGLYVGGSSGECIYQTTAERRLTLEAVMEEAAGKVTGDESLEREGELDRAKGDLKQSGEKIKDALKD